MTFELTKKEVDQLRQLHQLLRAGIIRVPDLTVMFERIERNLIDQNKATPIAIQKRKPRKNSRAAIEEKYRFMIRNGIRGRKNFEIN